MLVPGNHDRMVTIGKDIPSDIKKEIVNVLREYKDIFAWGPEDMLGCDRVVAEHNLNVQKDYTGVKLQKKGNFAPE